MVGWANTRLRMWDLVVLELVRLGHWDCLLRQQARARASSPRPMPLVLALPCPWVRDEAFSLEYGGPALPWGGINSPAAVSNKRQGQVSQDQQGVGWLSMSLAPQHTWCPYPCAYTSYRHQQGPKLQQDQGPRHGPQQQLWSGCYHGPGGSSGHPHQYDFDSSKALRQQHGLRQLSRPCASAQPLVGQQETLSAAGSQTQTWLMLATQATQISMAL